MTVYGYCRVSSHEQVAGTSLEDQERVIKGCAMMRGDGEPEMFVDPGVSGVDPMHTRPEGGRLLGLLRRGDILIVSKLDRMFRSASDALSTADRLKQRGIKLVLCDMGAEPVTENGASKMFFGMLALMAEFENDRRSERLADGRRGKKARGGHIGGYAPYGFRKVGIGRAAVLEVDRTEQAIVARMHLLKKAGKGCGAIADAMTEAGVRNRAGKPFAKMQVSRILSREIGQ